MRLDEHRRALGVEVGGAAQGGRGGAEELALPSLLAVGCAAASFGSGALFGALLAVAAIAFGCIGAVLALSSRRRGGVLSVVSGVAGLAGILAAAVKLLLLVL